MNLKATANNVIFAVKNKVKSTEELLVDTGEQENIIIGVFVDSGPDCTYVFNETDEICAYVNRVAVIPWAIEGFVFYTVKEENIVAVKEEEDEEELEYEYEP